ncbi:Siva family protein [Schizosaccharomyces osmophilus]|uniref:Siva family protein n=1 Tax=Schizosaccharomyces osmophilus TaxID=2545709 RepID=A0AAE9W8S1_9SCHI|nr:Siva family protein [Schizosaccharomyces osmophilus]WBW71774.1 Siva family protein [Schizosaccharomyces osmophilus]
MVLKRSNAGSFYRPNRGKRTKPMFYRENASPIANSGLVYNPWSVASTTAAIKDAAHGDSRMVKLCHVCYKKTTSRMRVASCELCKKSTCCICLRECLNCENTVCSRCSKEERYGFEQLTRLTR